MSEKPLTEDEIPKTKSGKRMPYDVVMDEDGEVRIGPSIFDQVAEDEQQRAADEGRSSSS